MATVSSKGMRNPRKLDKPRPLKSVSSIESDTSVLKDQFSCDNEKTLNAEEVLKELDLLNVAIANGNFDLNTNSLIMRISMLLKHCGQQLEFKYKDQLDRYFETLRNASRLEQIGLQARARILEIIELRASSWKAVSSYYNQKLTETSTLNSDHITGVNALLTSATLPANFIPGQPYTSASHLLSHSHTQILTPGEVIKNSGKFPHPTKIPGKNFYKDEVVIRNSDSGKVMGIKGRRVHMIEELSDTVISFQRVSPGAKDRLVQITGPSEDNIDQAKGLIEETIRRNASPVREHLELSLATRLGSESSTSLNSTTSEESVGNSLPHSQIPAGNAMFSLPEERSVFSSNSVNHSVQSNKVANNKKQLVHSHSTGDASVGEYSYSVLVGSELIRLSGTNVDLIWTAKTALEKHFMGQTKLEEAKNETSKNQSQKEPLLIQHNLRQSHSQGYPSPLSAKRFSLSDNNVFQFGLPSPQQIITAFKPVLMKQESSNGQPTSSSEEDATLKAGENSPTTEEEEVASRVDHNEDKVELIHGHSLSRMKSVTDSLELSAFPKNDTKDTKNVLKYSREFLLMCRKHPICKKDPKDAAVLAELAPLIVRRPSSERVLAATENVQ